MSSLVSFRNQTQQQLTTDISRLGPSYRNHQRTLNPVD